MTTTAPGTRGTDARRNRTRLLLFDIDGTLLRCGRQVGERFVAALLEIYGKTGDLAATSFAGRTDPAIVIDLMTGAGFSRSEVLDRLPAMKAAYLERMQSGLDESKVKVFPGVDRLLSEAAAHPGLELGLVTGNWREGARIKLASKALDGLFDCGGFGDDGIDRRELPPAALRRAQLAHGYDYAGDDVLVIGDTTWDVDCARSNGMRSLAVATGGASAEELAAAGADRVVATLEEVDVAWLAEA